MKEQTKDILLDAIRRNSERNLGRLASDLVRAASEEKEAILADMQLERWLAENCRECLSQPPGAP